MRTKQPKRTTTPSLGAISPTFLKLGIYSTLLFSESKFVLSRRRSWGIQRHTTSTVCGNEACLDRRIFHNVCGQKQATKLSKSNTDHLEKLTTTVLSFRGGDVENGYDIQYQSNDDGYKPNNLKSNEHESDVDDDYDEDDFDDDGIDNNSGFDASTSSTALATTFYPPTMKCSEIAFALRLTCMINDRLHTLATQSNKHNMKFLAQNHHEQYKLFRNHPQLMGVCSTTYTSPQGRLRGGSSTYNIQNQWTQQSYQQPQYTNEIHKLLSSNQVQDGQTITTGTLYSRINDSFIQRSISQSPFISHYVQSASQDNFDIEPYLLFLTRHVFDIVPLTSAATSKHVRSHLVDSKEQQSRLEMALAMIYLDRACSVETPRTDSRSNGYPVTACPPCSKATVHRLVLTSLLLSISSVRGISIEEIIKGKVSHLCEVLYGHPATEQQCHIQLLRDLKHMVQLMKDALGDTGIPVTPNQMKAFRQMWESSFGRSQ